MGKLLAYAVLLCLIAMAIAWHSLYGFGFPHAGPAASPAGTDAAWLDDLYSQNPRDTERAEARLAQLGEQAIPPLRARLRDGSVGIERKKAALKACSRLEQVAAPLIPEVSALLTRPELTEEAALALSFMGRAAFGPLRQASSSADPAVRREALRSIGKLKARAPLDARVVVPALVDGMRDPDAGVRAVAATYLGIVHEAGEQSVPVLMAGLDDADIEVRRASATALGAFGEAAHPALPALRKAAGDRDPDLAREAGLAIIRLQPPRR